MALFIGCRESFYAGSIEAIRNLHIQIAKFGNLKDIVGDFQGIIVSSHKGWSDFFTLIALNFCSCVSRALVAIAIPGAGLVAHLGGGLLLFRRSSGDSKNSKDIKALQAKVDLMSQWYYDWICNVNPRLLVYPEGHRNPNRGTLKMRTGTFRIAYSKKIPCLIAPSEGSQNIVKEKTFFFHKKDVDLTKIFDDKDVIAFDPHNSFDDDGYHLPPNAPPINRLYRGLILFNIHEIVDPKDYQDFDSFFKKCEDSFKEGYELACKKYDELTQGTTVLND